MVAGAVALATTTAGAVFTVAGPASAATNQPTFFRADLPSLANANIAVDLNGDGRLDLAGLGARTAAVVLSTGDGSFGARTEFPVADFAQDLTAGDFDRDGRTDLAVTINTSSVSVSLLRGNGDGTFQDPVNIPNTTNLDSPAIVATDVDNNGRTDLLVGHQISCFTAPCVVGRTVSVLLGNGDGSFQPAREVDVGVGISKIAVGDFDRDGNRDLAVAGSSSRLYLLHGRGDGSFAQQPTRTLTADTLGVDATDVDVANFNGDGIQDLVVAIGLNGSRTAVLLGHADGTFGDPLILTDPELRVPQYVAVADYNLDGFQDLALALADGSSGLMQIRNGNGDGTFQGPVNHQIPPPLSSIGGVAILSAPLDSDPRPDIALAWGGASSGMAVLRNATGTAPPPTPAAPTLRSPAQDATPTQPVAFDWSDVTGAASYRIQVDDSSTFTNPLVIDQVVTASQFTTTTLAARRHWWRVRAVNSVGVAGPYSTVRRFTPRSASQTPPSATAALSAVSVTPTTVTAGGSAQGTVTLTSVAPSGGIPVTLSSSKAAASVPGTLTVPAGASSARFPVTTAAVSAPTPVTITANAGSLVRTTTLTVNPVGQTAATLTLTATGRSGERITSTPSGLNVAVGSTGSASLATGTSITLSVSDGRDAIWSGACSSGGEKTRTCRFTLNGDATVTGDVQ